MRHPDPRLLSLQTPCLLVDVATMDRNIHRLANRLDGLGVRLRPHLKTAKSLDIARRQLAGGVGPATVSTLAEAEAFAAAGVRDILYAVGISANKLERVARIRASGCDLAVVLDSLPQAQALVEASRRTGSPIPALIEIDCDGHRGGMRADDPALLTLAELLVTGGAELRGVLTHAGESYGAIGVEARAALAEQERKAVVDASAALRSAGYPCPVVSVGSTPTAHAARQLDGITEVRAGVYVFFDLVMAGLGVCQVDDIALSVLTTVIGHQHEKGWTLVDAGWMALSRDRGTATQAVDQGYGVVCDAQGRVIEDLIVTAVNQEHGTIERRRGSTMAPLDLPVGTLLRILPNHACATAAQHGDYVAVTPDPATPLAQWPRIRGW